MLKKTSFVIAAFFLILGCIPSLHPLYTDDDITFDQALLGVWEADDGNSGYKFMSDDSITYTMIYTEDSVSSNFIAHLVQLGEHRFLDVIPDEHNCGNEFYNAYLIAAHSFYKVTLEKNQLRLGGLDYDWVKEQLESGSLKLAHEILDDGNIVLTAATRDLQNFVISNATNDEVFTNGDLAYRRE